MKKTLHLLLISVIWVISGSLASAHDFEDVVLTTPPSNFRITGNNNSLITGSVCNRPVGTLTLPIVFWVIKTNATDSLVTRAQIDEAKRILNQDFANSAGFFPSTQLAFDYAKRTPSGGVTSGVNYYDGSSLPAYSQYGVNVVSNATGFSVYDFGGKGLTWDHQRYLNVYIVDSIYNNYGGVAINLPNFFGEGVFVKASELVKSNAHTLTHEIGHYLNLQHTFQGDNGFNCPSNSNCANDGDGCCDTPPHRGIDAFLTTPCYSGSDVLNSLQNFMSYGSIKNRFTPDQSFIMNDYTVRVRSGLFTGNALLPPTTALEIAVATIENGDVLYACGKGDYQFTLTNEGLDSVSTCTVKAYVDDVVAKTAVMPINLGKGATGFYTLAGVPISMGAHTMKIEISKFNGSLSDFSSANNTMCKTVDVQKKMFYVAAIGNSDVSATGTGNYLCDQQVNFEASYDTVMFDFDAWRDEAGQTRSVSRYWSFNADSNVYFMPSVTPKKITSIINHGQDNSVKIYPNPVTDRFTVEFKNSQLSNPQLEVIDILGRILQTQEILNTSVVDISQLPAGSYIVRIYDDQYSNSFKILKN